jgi:hypothetical protein
MVQSAKGQSFDINSPQGKMIVNSPNYKQPFTASSPALDLSSPKSEKQTLMQKAGGMLSSAKSNMGGLMGAGNILKGILAATEESALYLKAMAPDATTTALNKANVIPDPEGDEAVEKKPGFFGRMKEKATMPSLKKLGLIAIVAGVMFFAEKLKPVIAKLLEFFKFVYNLLKTAFTAVFDYIKDFFADPVGTLKKSLAAVLDGLASLGEWIWDKAIKPVWDWITGLFDSGPGLVIKERFLAVAGVFTSFGQWIWDKAIKPVWDWISGIFKSKEDEDGGFIKQLFDTYVGIYTSMGQWIWDKAIKPVWDWISGIFKREDDKGGSMIKKIFMTAVGVYTGMGQWIWDNAIKPVWDWITGIFKRADDASGGAISGIFTKIVGPFLGFGQWIWDSAIKPVWDWISGIFKREDDKGGGFIKTLFATYVGAFTGIGQWIWDNAIKPVWDWISGIFSSDDDKEGGFISSLFTAYVGAYAKIGQWIWDKAIKPVWDWVSGIFGFGEDEESDAEKEKFSLFQLVKDAAAGMFAYLKGLFTFSPDTMKGMKDGMANMGTFMSAIRAGAWGAIKSPLSPIDGFMAAFDATLAEGGLARKSQIQTIPSETTPMGASSSDLAAQSAMLDASTGGVTVIDASTKTSNSSTTQDTYNQQELATEHNESTAKSGTWWNPFD